MRINGINNYDATPERIAFDQKYTVGMQIPKSEARKVIACCAESEKVSFGENKRVIIRIIRKDESNKSVSDYFLGLICDNKLYDFNKDQRWGEQKRMVTLLDREVKVRNKRIYGLRKAPKRTLGEINEELAQEKRESAEIKPSRKISWNPVSQVRVQNGAAKFDARLSIGPDASSPSEAQDISLRQHLLDNNAYRSDSWRYFDIKLNKTFQPHERPTAEFLRILSDSEVLEMYQVEKQAKPPNTQNLKICEIEIERRGLDDHMQEAPAGLNSQQEAD